MIFTPVKSLAANGFLKQWPPLLRFIQNKKGATAVEFALILPVLVLMYVSTVEITQAIGAQRKVAIASGMIGDLTTQYETMDAQNMSIILKSARAVMKPYDSGEMTSRITSVKFDGSGNPSVTWSRHIVIGGAGEEELTEDDGSTVSGDIPADLRIPDTTIIVSEIAYNYLSPFQMIFTETKPLRHVAYFRPRLGSTLPYQASTPLNPNWPLMVNGAESGQLHEDYAGYGLEYMLPPRAVARDSATPENPSEEIENAWYCETGQTAECDETASPYDADGWGSGGGGGGGCYKHDPLVEVYLMALPTNPC